MLKKLLKTQLSSFSKTEILFYIFKYRWRLGMAQKTSPALRAVIFQK
jgi:hypothetical protein